MIPLRNGRACVTGMLLACLLIAACARDADESAAVPPAGASAPPPASTAGAPAPAAPPAADAQAIAAQLAAAQSWQPSALDELLAPIALYPDALVGQILAASTSSQEVLDAGNWLIENPSLTGNALDTAAANNGFSPAVRSLIQFPTVIDMMCRELDWTKQVGNAFTADQKSVLDSIQRLRAQAAAVGNLKSTPQQTVTKEVQEEKAVIVVKPAEPQVVYVPQYNPQVVYTQPPPQQTTVVQEGHSDSEMLGAGLLGFTAGVLLTKAFDDDDDYYYGPHWGAGAVYVGPRPYSAAHYPYRPAYGPAFRPATGYRPPVNYRHNYQNNSNNNIVINNNNYFNKAAKNTELDKYRGANNVNARTQPARGDDWRGRQEYAGASQSPAAVTRDRQSQRVQTYEGNTRARADEYAGSRDRAGSQTAATTRAQGNRSQFDRQGQDRAGVDRGFDRQDSARSPAGSNRQADRGALSHVNDGGGERAASARGRESAGTRELRSGGGGRRR